MKTRHRQARPHDLRPRPGRRRRLAADAGGGAAGARLPATSWACRPSSRPAAARACTWWCRSSRSYDWDTVKDFSQADRAAPGAHASRSASSPRAGRRTASARSSSTTCATASARPRCRAWSARARPGLGISVPVRWDELRRPEERRALDRAQRAHSGWTRATSRGPTTTTAAPRLAAAMKTLGFKPASEGEPGPMSQQWPRTLWIVRHGQSAGNVARDAAEAAGLSVIDIAERDIDVPLSPLGREQSVALGHWFGELPPDAPARGGAVLALRARPRDRALLLEAGRPRPRKVRVRVDERLREKEFGILDRLTVHGIRAEVSRAGRAARARRQVLLPPARRRELVRRDPAPAQRARDGHARARRPARADRGAPGDRQLHALPARVPGRSTRSWRSTARATCPTAA